MSEAACRTIFAGRWIAVVEASSLEQLYSETIAEGSARHYMFSEVGADMPEMTSAFVQAAVILLREGLEALLVIAALSAYVAKTGARERLSALYTGAGLALVASMVMAWVFERFNNGQHNDLLEGLVIWAAAALMLYVSGWLFIRSDPQTWQAYLKEHADKALSQQTGLAVAVLAFLAVFREGAETVLFVHALAKTSGGWSAALIAGLIVAAVALVVLFFVINVVAQKLPLRPVFIVTSAFLFFMAIKFIGEGMQEFQEQQYISYTVIRSGQWLLEIGFNPTWEAVITQLVVIALAIVTVVIATRRERVQAASQG
jgi:high-affinity iron transporter